ncbi:MAG: hypothetical protein PHF84_06675 [bacterium]|nr:hypothetical protein [bacterium]
MLNNKDRKTALFFLIMLLPVLVFSGVIEMKNEFIKIIGDPDTGRFIIKTTGGDPALPSDQNSLLLYEDYPPTSFTTLKMDESVYKFGDEKGTFSVRMNERENTITAVWSVANIELNQKLRFVKGPTTGNLDTVEISYNVLNKDFKEHQVGVRVMLDTYLGKEDGAPFRIPQLGDITSEKALLPNELPDYWYSYDDLAEPSVRAQGTLKVADSVMPDKVIYASWERFNKYLWDFETKPGRSFRRSVIGPADSAVAIFWNQRSLKPNENYIVRTYYGLYGASLFKGKVFNISLGGPVQTAGEPVTVTADVQNISPFTAKGCTAEIILPNGLKLGETEESKKSLEDIAINQIKKTFWSLVPTMEATGYVTFKVVVKGMVNGKEEKETVERRIEVKGEKKKTAYTLFDLSELNRILKAINGNMDENNKKLDELNALIQSSEAPVYPRDQAKSDQGGIKTREKNVKDVKSQIPEAVKAAVKHGTK